MAYSYYERKCENCGSAYAEGAHYCSNCQAPLPQQPQAEEEVLHGVRLADWRQFIDKNESRYLDLFKRKQEKRVFLHMNWAAFFFSFYWMLYRKMYKYTAILFAISIAFSLVTTAAITAAYKPQIDQAQAILEPYSQYIVTEADGTSMVVGDGSVDINEVLDAVAKSNTAIDEVIGEIIFWGFLFAFLIQLALGLLADCIYREHILHHIRYADGGTSVAMAILGVVVISLIRQLIESPLVSAVAEWILR